MIRSKSRTRDSAVAFRRNLSRALRVTAGSALTVGVQKGEGTYVDGTDVAMVALWNEFGTHQNGRPHIPERSFLRSAVNDNFALLGVWRVELLKKITAGTMSPARALEALGFRIQQLVVNKIKSNVPPPNAASTLSKKRAQGLGDRTLIATTLLLRSIKYKVLLAPKS